MLLHEASIIAAKERAEMKIEYFIARKIVVDGAGHSIRKRRFWKKSAGVVVHRPPARQFYPTIFIDVICIDAQLTI